MKERQRKLQEKSYLKRVSLRSLRIQLNLALLFAVMWGMLIIPYRVLAAGNTVTIHITGTAQPPGFRPLLVTVHTTDTILFLNDAQPAATYTIAADDQRFVSPPIAPNQQWSMMLNQIGTYEYHALNVSPSMVGLIVVAPTTVKLLATPAPGAVATEIAQIQSEHRQQSNTSPSPQPGLSIVTVILMVVFGLVLIGCVVGGLLFLRRRQGA